MFLHTVNLFCSFTYCNSIVLIQPMHFLALIRILYKYMIFIEFLECNKSSVTSHINLINKWHHWSTAHRYFMTIIAAESNHYTIKFKQIYSVHRAHIVHMQFPYGCNVK